MSALSRSLSGALLLFAGFTLPAQAAEGPMVEVVPVTKALVRDELITFG